VPFKLLQQQVQLLDLAMVPKTIAQFKQYRDNGRNYSYRYSYCKFCTGTALQLMLPLILIQPLYYHRFQGQTIQQIVLILYLYSYAIGGGN
jgi:hypothetical protein